MPTITQLQYIVAVDRFRHFGKAAQACHVAQPSLSAQIQKLEELLDIVIFDRSKKPILVTDVGRDILDQAQLILTQHRKLYDLANNSYSEPRGNFHLAVIPTLAPYIIPIFLKQFAQRFPRLNLKINEYKTEDIIAKLQDDEIDAGLLVTPLEEEDVIERHLFLEPFYVYLSEDHPLAGRKFVAEGDLDASNLWLLEEGHCFRDQVIKVCSRNRPQNILPNVEFAGGNFETLKHLIQQNSGYTLLPQLAVKRLSEDEAHRHIRRFRKPVPTREVSLVHSRSFLKENAIAALESVILDCLPKDVRSLKRQDAEIIGILRP